MSDLPQVPNVPKAKITLLGRLEEAVFAAGNALGFLGTLWVTGDAELAVLSAPAYGTAAWGGVVIGKEAVGRKARRRAASQSEYRQQTLNRLIFELNVLEEMQQLRQLRPEEQRQLVDLRAVIRLPAVDDDVMKLVMRRWSWDEPDPTGRRTLGPVYDND